MKFVFIIALVAVVIATGGALECISCVEGPEHLTEKFRDGLSLKTCDDRSICVGAIFCAKQVIQYSPSIIIRYCVRRVPSRGIRGINFCSSNFCNSSSTLFITTTLFLLSLVTLFL